MSVDTRNLFSPEVESVEEFLQRFKLQHGDKLEAAGDNRAKKARILANALPTAILTDIQRRLKPKLLTDSTYDDLERNLIASYTVKKSIIGAAVTFVNRKQKAHENIESYSKALNELASKCSYNDCCRDRLLRDVFVSGLRSHKLISAVITDCEEKTFMESVERAKNLEQVYLDVEDIHPSVKVHSQNKIDKYRVQSSSKIDSESTKKTPPNNYVCLRCGSRNKHYVSNCFAIKLKCNLCQKTGHLAKVCKTKAKTTELSSNYLEPVEEEDPFKFTAINTIKQPSTCALERSTTSNGSKAAAQQRSTNGSADQLREVSSDAELQQKTTENSRTSKSVLAVTKVSKIGSEPIVVDCEVNKYPVKFEVDTGSYCSTINVLELKNIRNVKINSTSRKAIGYGANVIKFLGETNLNIKCNNVNAEHTFLVVDKNSVSLLGRDLCKKLNIKVMFSTDNNCTNAVNQDVFQKHKSYLSDNFKSCVKEKIILKVDPKCSPIFCKARSVPIRYKTLVKKELDRLVQHKIITKVYNSNWACPTVNVLKPDGNIRICRDYSLTINQCMSTVKYPLPSVKMY